LVVVAERRRGELPIEGVGIIGRSSTGRSAREVAPVSGRRRGAALAAVIATVVLGGFLVLPTSAANAAPTDACRHPAVPKWFHKNLVTAIRIAGDLPSRWADSPTIPKIVCWQGTKFDRSFIARGDAYHTWRGVFAMTTDEVLTIAGPWMIADRNGFRLTIRCFVHGWDSCPHTAGNTRITQQLISGLRWIWLQYGSPTAAWARIMATGRFNSSPRPGTDNRAIRRPFRLCPVAGSVGYRDDFGQPRHVGGDHLHWGNDIGAPQGRNIRAPFYGLAVAHSDDWFAGNYVTVVGAKGYVRNDHLQRFGALGVIKAGTVIGHVGETGDATSTHDHFEWHPWVVPTPLHRAPSGFRRIMDAIDPYTFLNMVC
jgi:hypothetical protein